MLIEANDVLPANVSDLLGFDSDKFVAAFNVKVRHLIDSSVFSFTKPIFDIDKILCIDGHVKMSGDVRLRVLDNLNHPHFQIHHAVSLDYDLSKLDCVGSDKADELLSIVMHTSPHEDDSFYNTNIDMLEVSIIARKRGIGVKLCEYLNRLGDFRTIDLFDDDQCWINIAGDICSSLRTLTDSSNVDFIDFKFVGCDSYSAALDYFYVDLPNNQISMNCDFTVDISQIATLSQHVRLIDRRLQLATFNVSGSAKLTDDQLELEVKQTSSLEINPRDSTIEYRLSSLSKFVSVDNDLLDSMIDEMFDERVVSALESSLGHSDPSYDDSLRRIDKVSKILTQGRSSIESDQLSLTMSVSMKNVLSFIV